MLGPQCQLFSGLHVSVRILTDYNRELARRGYHLLLVAIKKLGLKAGIANEVVHIGFLLCVLCVEPQEKSLITGLYELKKAPSHVVKGEILEVCGLQTWYLWSSDLVSVVSRFGCYAPRASRVWSCKYHSNRHGR